MKDGLPVVASDECSIPRPVEYVVPERPAFLQFARQIGAQLAATEATFNETVVVQGLGEFLYVVARVYARQLNQPLDNEG